MKECMNNCLFELEFVNEEDMTLEFGEVIKVSTDNYDDLFNKPRINTVTVEGEKTGADYRLQDKMDVITEQMIDNIFYGRT